jgi:hypothetical protein
MFKPALITSIFLVLTLLLKAQNTLPTLIADLPQTRYFDWGKPPIVDPEGPGEPWVHPHNMCHTIYNNCVASNTLAPQGKNNYAVSNLSDDNPKTAWVEGQDDYGIGTYLEFTNFIIYGSELHILNGYQSSQTSWENNSRVKKLKVSCDGKELCILELGDVMGIQTFTFNDMILEKINPNQTGKEKTIRFTIMDVYPGIKWKDTAITEIFMCGG